MIYMAKNSAMLFYNWQDWVILSCLQKPYVYEYVLNSGVLPLHCQETSTLAHRLGVNTLGLDVGMAWYGGRKCRFARHQRQ